MAYKDPRVQANDLLRKPDYLSDNYIKRIQELYSGITPYNNYNDLKKVYSQRVMQDYGVDQDTADLLVDGAMSNPNYDREPQPYQAYGRFESVPMVKGTDGIQAAQELLKANPGHFGAIYGYGTNSGKDYVLKQPFLVKDQNDINRYQKALSGNTSFTKLKGIYPTASELKGDK